MRSPSRPLTLSALALAGALALSACGSAGAPSGTSEPSGSSSGATTPAPAQSGSSAGAGTGAGEGSSSAPVGPTTGAWAVDQQTAQRARDAVEQMSTEQMAGQVLVATWDGADQAAVDAQARQIRDLHLGGVIIMGSNVPTAGGQGQTLEDSPLGGAQGVDRQGMQRITEQLSGALAEGRDWPGLISVDQEGGPVARLGAPLTEWPDAATMGRAGDPQLTQQAYEGLGSELAGLGFTMDHAPVADVTTPQDAVIRERSFGTDPQRVAEQSAAASAGLTRAGIAPTPKHFPGHGSVGTDSHVGLPVQSRSIDQLRAQDWVPFQRAVDQGTPAIMMGHIAVDAWNPQIPSSLDPQAYQALRQELGFHGAVVTDALNMAAVTEAVGPGRAVDTGVSTPAGAALQAGADLLLMPADEQAARADIVQAVESGAIPRERLVEAATRVVALQLTQQRVAEQAPVAPSAPGTHQDAARRF